MELDGFSVWSNQSHSKSASFGRVQTDWGVQLQMCPHVSFCQAMFETKVTIVTIHDDPKRVQDVQEE